MNAVKDRNYLKYLGNNRQYYVTASYDEHHMSEVWGPWRVELKECTDYNIYPIKNPESDRVCLDKYLTY